MTGANSKMTTAGDHDTPDERATIGRARRFLPATALVGVILCLAPGAGWLRDLIFKRAPDLAVPFLGLAAVVVGIAVVVYAAARIRGGRWPRWLGLGGVCVLLWLQTGFETGRPNVDVVERIHVFEYGLLAYLLYRGFRAGRRSGEPGDLAILGLTMCWLTVAGVLDEGLQWLLPQRIGEIRDVALNVVAGLAGLLFGLSVDSPATWTWRLPRVRGRLLARTAALTVLIVGLFVFAVHLAYEIDDPEIGRFRSRYTADELHRLAAERAREWAAHPPTGLEIFGFEDYFLSEAAWHVSHRNASYGWNDHYLAWQANRILEKYYDPFLDIPSFRGSGIHRYPPGIRADLEKKARPDRHDPKAYLSPVLLERLFPWSKPLFLTLLGAVVLGLWLLPSAFGRGRPSG